MNTVVHQVVLNSAQVRAVADEKGNIFFCANDVCDILGYKNARRAVSKHCLPRGVMICDTPTSIGPKRMQFISEGNLFRLVIKSNTQQAAPFEAWVCDEVLPSIRRKGFYADLDGRLTSIGDSLGLVPISQRSDTPP